MAHGDDHEACTLCLQQKISDLTTTAAATTFSAANVASAASVDPWAVAKAEKDKLEAMLEVKLTDADVPANPVYTPQDPTFGTLTPPGCSCSKCHGHEDAPVPDPPGSQGHEGAQDPPGSQYDPPFQLRSYTEPWFTSYDDLREAATFLVWDRYPLPLLHVDEERDVVDLAALRYDVTRWVEVLNQVTRRGEWVVHGRQPRVYLMVDDAESAIEQICGRCGGHGTVLLPEPPEVGGLDPAEEVDPDTPPLVNAETCTRCVGRGRENISAPTVERNVPLGVISCIWNGNLKGYVESRHAGHLRYMHTGALLRFSSPNNFAGEVMRSWPGLALYCTYCPAVGRGAEPSHACHMKQLKRIFDVVIHLNDFHKWTREKIAEWLDALECDQGIDLGPFNWTPEHEREIPTQRGGSA